MSVQPRVHTVKASIIVNKNTLIAPVANLLGGNICNHTEKRDLREEQVEQDSG